MILPSLSTRIPGGALSASLLVNTRQFPGTLGAWNSAFPSVTAPTNLWPMQDATPGSPTVLAVDDTIGSVDLTSNTNGDEYYQQTGDPYGRYGVYLEDLGSHLRAAATGSLDQTTGSFSVLYRFKSVGAPASGHYFARKKSITSNTNGWSTSTNSSGNMIANLDSPASTAVAATVALNFFDGLYHDVLAVIDRTGALLSLFTDLGNASASISAHAGGSLTNAIKFGFGDTDGNLNACARVQYTYAAFFNYALTSTHFATIRAGG